MEVRFVKDYKDQNTKQNYKIGEKAIFEKDEANFLIKADIAIKVKTQKKKLPKSLLLIPLGIIVLIVIYVIYNNSTKVAVPDVENMSIEEAIELIESQGLYVNEVETSDEYVEEGKVVYTDYYAGEKVPEGTIIDVYVSTGPEITYASDSVIQWWHIDGSENDVVNFQTPYIKGNYLYVDMEITYDSYYAVTFRGFGIASISDTFSKTVPLSYTYDIESPTRGTMNKVQLKIPVQDLDVQRPTSLFLKLCLYVNNNPYDMRVDLSISW